MTEPVGPAELAVAVVSDALECIDAPIEALPGKPWTGRQAAPCTGVVELRESLSGTGTPIARCDGHWAARLEFQRELDRRYPEHAPPDWSPLDAGERWNEDDPWP